MELFLLSAGFYRKLRNVLTQEKGPKKQPAIYKASYKGFLLCTKRIWKKIKDHIQRRRVLRHHLLQNEYFVTEISFLTEGIFRITLFGKGPQKDPFYKKNPQNITFRQKGPQQESFTLKWVFRSTLFIKIIRRRVQSREEFLRCNFSAKNSLIFFAKKHLVTHYYKKRKGPQKSDFLEEKDFFL